MRMPNKLLVVITKSKLFEEVFTNFAVLMSQINGYKENCKVAKEKPDIQALKVETNTLQIMATLEIMMSLTLEESELQEEIKEVYCQAGVAETIRIFEEQQQVKELSRILFKHRAAFHSNLITIDRLEHPVFTQAAKTLMARLLNQMDTLHQQLFQTPDIGKEPSLIFTSSSLITAGSTRDYGDIDFSKAIKPKTSGPKKKKKEANIEMKRM